MSQELPDFDQLWDYGNPADTEAKFREILPQAQASGNSAYHVELLTQIARTLGLQMKFDEAHALLDDVEKMLTSDMQRPRIRYLLERGRVFNSSGSPQQSKPVFAEAWDIGCNCGEGNLAVDAAHMLAIVEDSSAALEWNEKALNHANNSHDPKARHWRAILYNNVGWTYHDRGQFEVALESFENALKACQELGKEERIRIARWCIGRTLRSLGRIEEALAIHETQLKEYEAIGEKPGFTYEELGECLLLLNREDEAGTFFALAYAELSQNMWLVRDEAERLNRLKQLST